MVGFRLMNEAEFTRFNRVVIEEYAQVMARNIGMSLEEAQTASSKQISELLKQGLATPDHFLYMIIAAPADEHPIGWLWIAIDEQRRRCFIYDIAIEAEYRSQGWGRRTLELLETTMRAKGIQHIGLNVFGDNEIAQQLYTTMGYRPVSIAMRKQLT